MGWMRRVRAAGCRSRWVAWLMCVGNPCPRWAVLSSSSFCGEAHVGLYSIRSMVDDRKEAVDAQRCALESGEEERDGGWKGDKKREEGRKGPYKQHAKRAAPLTAVQGDEIN